MTTEPKKYTMLTNKGRRIYGRYSDINEIPDTYQPMGKTVEYVIRETIRECSHIPTGMNDTTTEPIFDSAEMSKFYQIFGKHYWKKTRKEATLKWVFDDYPHTNLSDLLDGKVKKPRAHHRAIIEFWRFRIASGGRTIRQEEGDGC